jgi:UDP-N-acetyl-D-mannosaminuronic acid dehydrogenase
VQARHICVIGLGYIGLPTAAVFASRGFTVTGVDVNPHAVDTVNLGRIHIVEPDLDMVVHAAVTEGRLRATGTPEPADVFILAVPTPFTHDHEPDLSFVEAAARAIAPVLQRGNLVILESTSPVGTTERMAGWLASCRPDLTFPRGHGENSDIRIAHCPERVLPGHILRELVHNDRVIGGLTPRCAAAAVELYQTFVEGECITTDVRTAEMCKLTENTFRDVNIALANELSIICDKLDIDVWELIRLANRHPRVNVLQPGSGVGGHCIAVDPWFIVHSAPGEARLIRAAREVNTTKPKWLARRILREVHGHQSRAPGRPVRVALFGLAFKPDIDDLRESPAVQIALELHAACPEAQLLAVEPHIAHLPATLHFMTLCPVDRALGEADIMAVLVGHRAFRELPGGSLQGKIIIDATGTLASSPAPHASNRAGQAPARPAFVG